MTGMATHPDSFSSRGTLTVRGATHALHRLDALGARASRLPVSLRVLL